MGSVESDMLKAEFPRYFAGSVESDMLEAMVPSLFCGKCGV